MPMSKANTNAILVTVQKPLFESTFVRENLSSGEMVSSHRLSSLRPFKSDFRCLQCNLIHLTAVNSHRRIQSPHFESHKTYVFKMRHRIIADCFMDGYTSFHPVPIDIANEFVSVFDKAAWIPLYLRSAHVITGVKITKEHKDFFTRKYDFDLEVIEHNRDFEQH